MKNMLPGMVLVAFLAGGGLAAVNLALDRTQTTRQTVGEPISEIVVKSGGGDVDLVPTGGRIEVRQTQHYVLSKPKLKLHVENAVLTLDSDCSAKILKCYADLRVALPTGVAVTVEADSGDIGSREINVRSVHARSDSGNVLLVLIGRQRLVWAHAGSGRVDVIAANARAVDAQSGSGDVAVDVFRRAPRRVRAHSDSGSVQVLALKGDYAINANTDSGQVKIDGLIRNARAANSIDARSDSGDIALRAR
jgi:DUF4097 and DUF4098 domain-containing protein YvlB